MFLPRDERFLGLTDACADPERAGCVVVPVPFEQTSSWRAGSDAGPLAVLEASRQVELFDCARGVKAHVLSDGIATRAPLDVGGRDGAGVADTLEAEVGHWLDRGRRVVTLGGEHTSVVGAIRAHVARRPDVTVLQLDAHADLRPEYLGDPWSHACAMTRVLDVHDRLVQVGVRSQTSHERALAERLGIPVFYGEAIVDDEAGGVDWIGAVLAATGPAVYLTFDCDVLDPALMPATGTPEPGGLGWRAVDRLLRRLCAERELVGFDVSELAPVPHLVHPQQLVAKLVQRLIAYQFTDQG